MPDYDDAVANEKRTTVLRLDPLRPAEAALQRAAAVLHLGGLVAFPTETVYGLGAIATRPDAVARVFAAKGRPPRNPLIVHVADVAGARALVQAWPSAAERLAEACWPGPLTLVLPRGPQIPDAVTGGGPTVAVRVPAHPVALALLRAVGAPLAAPSANRSSHISPTQAAHVLADLDGRIEMLLDAGATPGGIESTVVDLGTTPPRLLRPGLVTPARLRQLLPDLELSAVARAASDATGAGTVADAPRSPGHLGRHYAPRARVECCVDDATARVAALSAAGLRCACLRCGTPATDRLATVPDVQTASLPAEVHAYAAQLYATLRELDAGGPNVIVVELPPDTEAWLAVRDRLLRAARE